MKIFIVAFLNLFFLAQTNAQTAEKELVRKTFENYKAAILNDNAKEAFKNIDSRTEKYYTEILDEVKNADSIKINSMSLIDKVTILSVRSKAKKSEILAMQGSQLFLYAIENGMVGKNSVSNNGIGEITINNNFAKGKLKVNGKEVPFYFHFYNEQGQWKLDLTSLFPASNMAFKAMVKESELEENEYLFSLLEIMNGSKPSSSIWEPLN